MNILNKQQIVDLTNEFVSSDKFNSSDDCKNSVRSFVNWVKNNKGFEPEDRKSTRLNSSHSAKSRMPSSA